MIVLFLLIILLIVGVILFGMFYILKQVRQYSFVKAMINKNKYTAWGMLVLLLVLIGIGLWLDHVNTLIVLLHLVLIWMIVDGIRLLINKYSRHRVQAFVSGLVALGLTVSYLSYGYYQAHHVVTTHYSLSTSKVIDKNLRIVQISDSHIGATFHAEGFKKHMQIIQSLHPDLIVVTGDYVDDDTTRKDMLASTKALGQIKSTYGTYFVYGNHDKGYMNYRNFSDQDLEASLKENNIHILNDESVQIAKYITVVGRQDAQTESYRKSAQALMQSIDSKQYVIMLDHEPTDYINEANSHPDLVLSGHTHGGQMFPIGITGELSGANDMTYGIKTMKDTTFIVNSGISDWAIKFKTGGAKAEIGVIDIEKQSVMLEYSIKLV